jgi:hypothetical protein
MSAEWLFRKLSLIAARSAATVQVPVSPETKHAGARVRKPKLKPADPLACPDHISPKEWALAVANVMAGSAPSTIARGSDIPSDFTLRRNGLHTPR